MTTTIDGTRYVTTTNTVTGAQGLKWEGGLIPAEVLALVTAPADLVVARDLPLFKCQDCGAKHSAHTLFNVSDVPGSCPDCAADFFGCDLPGCSGTHHPDDPCDRS